MTIQELGSIGEFIGSLAVLLTLVYLAVQVKQSKKLLEENQRIALSQTYQTRAGFRMETFRFGMEPHGSELFAKFDIFNPDISAEERIATFETLSASEKVQVRNYYSMSLQAMDNTLYQGAIGLLDDEQMLNAKAAIANHYPVWMYVNALIPERIRQLHESMVR